MSIIIHGMKLPPRGKVNLLVMFDDGRVQDNSDGQNKWQSIELPSHGGLVDRNHLEVVSYRNREGMENTFDNGVKWMLEYIDKLTPVIPAEEEDNDG